MECKSDAVVLDNDRFIQAETSGSEHMNRNPSRPNLGTDIQLWQELDLFDLSTLLVWLSAGVGYL